jgi:hypothetical protein
VKNPMQSNKGSTKKLEATEPNQIQMNTFK